MKRIYEIGDIVYWLDHGSYDSVSVGRIIGIEKVVRNKSYLVRFGPNSRAIKDMKKEDLFGTKEEFLKQIKKNLEKELLRRIKIRIKGHQYWQEPKFLWESEFYDLE